ncbi:peptidase M17 [Mycoplasmopsis pullorum]|uniref:M17 family metallopeptidase n=1 Tax=Mycoplasmopsis pullorum TaxID=48003 RepID=UPI0011182AC8|nr:leucyl aminopeptidase family protein [Mycoplasmopsis pullorum]TNK83425.1 peptidase M17 [Mycoplasmopsis pullorum]TNK92069.1 peptidase M17 [Mycoplasmopsis pullorum]
MIRKLNNKLNEELFTLKAQYHDVDLANSWIVKKNGHVTEDVEKKELYIYIDKENTSIEELQKLFLGLSSKVKRDTQIDLDSFVRENITLEQILQIAVLKINFSLATLFKKSINPVKVGHNKIELYASQADDLQKLFNKFLVISQAINDCRNLQIMPENFLNSEVLAQKIVDDFQGIKNLKVKVLDKKDIEAHKMGLILSVNKGSTHEPRVVVIEYNGDNSTSDKTVLVGKGITFDTGGVNTKGYYMNGMKFDMSGSVIVAYAVKAVAQLEAKTNVSAVMMITDNRLDGDASLPENIYQSMSGKWVEVTDTDAEGRLVLADGLYYGATELGATTLVDVATLTGSLRYALGSEYTGVWSTSDENWDKFNLAAKRAQEKVWRMPMHADYHRTNLSSKVADLANYSSASKSDSNSAAMFLKEFTNNVPYIHCDVAFTADIAGEPQGALIGTLLEFVKGECWCK